MPTTPTSLLLDWLRQTSAILPLSIEKGELRAAEAGHARITSPIKLQQPVEEIREYRAERRGRACGYPQSGFLIRPFPLKPELDHTVWETTGVIGDQGVKGRGEEVELMADGEGLKKDQKKGPKKGTEKRSDERSQRPGRNRAQ